MSAWAKFCIVGAGFAGTTAFRHLVGRLAELRGRLDLAQTEIVTVEREAVGGPGYPYHPANLLVSHRCNNQARTMAIHGNDFVEWMRGNKPRLIAEHAELISESHPAADLAAWQPDGEECYPRALFGLYLAERFRETVAMAEGLGIAVTQYNRHEAVDGYSRAGRFHLTLRALDTDRQAEVRDIDKVLLATGHWEGPSDAGLARQPGYAASPYPPARVRAALASARSAGDDGRATVFVQGMGPSGIDAVLTLVDEGRFRYGRNGHVAAYEPPPGTGLAARVVAGSRCGFFSGVRGLLADHEFAFLTERRLEAIRRDNDGFLAIAPVLELLDAELRQATQGEIGWEEVRSPPFRSAGEKLAADLEAARRGDIVHTIVLKARRMRFYRELRAEEKAVYDRTLDTHFIRTAVPMPAANAEKLLALIDAGILDTVRIGYGTPPVSPAGADGRFTIFHSPDETGIRRFRADCVVRAAGQSFDMARHPSPFMRALLARGEIVAHEEEGHTLGGIALDGNESYRALKRSDGGGLAPSPHLVSYGAPVRFWQNERNYSGAFVEAAEWLAEDWADFALTRFSGSALPADRPGHGARESHTLAS